MRFGYKLMAEAFDPKELIRQAVRAEQAGFDFVEISDHYHPWLEEQGHSPFAWNVLSAIAARTDRLGLATGVTCPTVRYHPAIIAQAAATLAIISDGRFTLGIGSGERLNEHVTGQAWPSVRVRHEMLVEALDIINLLWQGGYRSYQGKHLRLDDARVWDLPDTLPVIAVAAGGRKAAELARTHGGGLFATEPRKDLVEAYGGSGPKYAEIPMAWAPTVEAAVEEAHRTSRWALTGWKVMTELPNPVNFDAASQTVRAEDVREKFVCGPDPKPYLDALRTYAEAGFDHLVLQNAGPDPDGFLEFFQKEIKPRS
ncbi:TIGR03557 family F420-dependent LLM class oxidoreductase [Actinoplanes oblitus]|uniref:TIGR03557 family F420-dependent LLM class oxidoreductase n=1 Tax=Actinoplanes oblitus TaxID=3040509 RepID=A0ABY8WNS3_9ACTN|nr:TIGR03557 family F420-dependent LLM class oxidoreductase [Actinoplanes oblitus]WIM99519.1 TIGR03557 family F420-dependent LLM class oxidoreductase [Actinoplanes oblitus]